MGTINERTLRMKQEFCQLRAEGYTPQEIAQKFGLSGFTVYHHLGEIAEANGVTRESLLEVPHNTSGTYERQFEPLQKIDLSNFDSKVQSIYAEFEQIKNEIATNMSTQKKIDQQLDEEEKTWQMER